MIKPILPFKATVPGSAHPKLFTETDEFDVSSAAAAAALTLGCLSDKDAKAVKAAQEGTSKKKRAAPAHKAQSAAPENKAAGSNA